MLTRTKTIDLINNVQDTIVLKANELRKYQNPTGQIVKNENRAKELLIQLMEETKTVYKELNLNEVGIAFEQDILNWLERGLNQQPFFDHTLAAYRPPKNGEMTFFIAPIITPNGPNNRGFYFEAFLAIRDEPDIMKPIEKELPHPKNGCQSLKILTGTQGFMEEKCIVFFPENVQTRKKVTSQAFAIFFFNKFHRIYHKDTLKRAKTIFKDLKFKSENMNEKSTYEARVIWGYLHDYYHHCGKKPFDQHIPAKMNFFAGILEEIKVDCQSIITLHERKYPYWEEIIEFILFERLLRYPSQHNATRNFDSGTGFFLFSWLMKNSQSIQKNKGHVSLNLQLCIQDLKKLILEIEELETIKNDLEYKKHAEQYVRKHLLPANNGDDKFLIPDNYFIYRDNLNIEIPYIKFSN
ncbi:DUF6421 family protein [Priestia abyssalis]|uniref:DUF6421 family protein n=1 Tax=Priestia abyssalis TaxID=1221450 RepID=UPI0009959D4E